MTTLRRKILQGALAGIVVTALFPPCIRHLGGGGVIGLGFNFVLSWPPYGTVDVSLLLTEWFGIAIVCGILWLLNRDPKTPGMLAAAIRLVESKANAKVDVAKTIAEAVIEVADNIIEKNVNARIEAAKIAADATIYAANVQSKMGD